MPAPRKETPAPSKQLIGPPRNPNTQTADPFNQRSPIFGLHDEVHVISLH
jgi:hypothetical protein